MFWFNNGSYEHLWFNFQINSQAIYDIDSEITIEYLGDMENYSVCKI